jgi:hypothetical protein
MNDFNCTLTAKDSAVGYYDSQNCWHPWNWYDYYTIYPTFYPQVNIVEDKMAKAFKVVSKLIEMKIIENIEVVKFIELVNKISEVL